MGNIINTGARWLSGGLAIWVGIRITIVGLLALHMGSQIGLFLLPMAFAFFVPALLAMCGGNLNWLRGLWGVMSVLLAGGLFFVRQSSPATQMVLTGLDALLAYCVIGLILSFVARQKKVEEDTDQLAEPFS